VSPSQFSARLTGGNNGSLVQAETFPSASSFYYIVLCVCVISRFLSAFVLVTLMLQHEAQLGASSKGFVGRSSAPIHRRNEKPDRGGRADGRDEMEDEWNAPRQFSVACVSIGKSSSLTFWRQKEKNVARRESVSDSSRNDHDDWIERTRLKSYAHHSLIVMMPDSVWGLRWKERGALRTKSTAIEFCACLFFQLFAFAVHTFLWR
jgi:hypothetical protein